MSQNVVSLVVTLAVWRPVVEIQLSFPSIISGFLYTGYTLQFFVSRNPLHLSSKANPGCLLSESMATMIQDTFFIFFIQPRLWPRQLRTTKLSKMTWPCKLWAIFSVGESKKCCSWLSAKSMVHCFFWKLWESYNQRPNMYPK